MNNLYSDELRILDIGCGPAVASLAITDIIACILRHQNYTAEYPSFSKVRIRYVLNDTESICLGVGQELLKDYYKFIGTQNQKLSQSGVLTVDKDFPLNMGQLRRISRNFGDYQIIILSYVLNPLREEEGLHDVADSLNEVSMLCNQNGRVLIVQDKFSESVIRQIANAIGQPCRKDTLSQEIYSNNNENETYTYSYYYCLFAPDKIISSVSVAASEFATR